jgi:hypothetical protein
VLFQMQESEHRKAREFITRQEHERPTPGSAIGGRWTYEFTPTTIGMVVRIRDGLTGVTEDVTNYEGF